ncbi:Crp/Fnr family transcriptional regulator [Aquimarina sediminis]|uniref:Crp/Fnr family transcriptional regulator n=1 Tax=Aquimarina sediminis TaxID=2070536 RepID=UPI000CA03C1F|nr:Crp/Fnr family transcriptional regulator [Aquimarina sediminis]
MNKNSIFEILKRNNIPDKYVSIFIECGTIQEIERHETLVKIGDISQQIYIVLKGGFVSQQMNGSNVPKTINFFLDNHEPYMSSFHSFFKEDLSPVQLMAIKKSTVLALNKNDIEKLNRTHTTFKDFFIKRLIHALLIENEFKSYLITKTSFELYNHIIENYPELIKSVPAKYIAEFMGISRVWLSNLKRQKFK